jgi:hypothetical protein
MTADLPEYHRAKCPVCGTVCEQRCRWVLCDGIQRTAYDCLECKAIYLAATEPAAHTTEEPTAAESHRLAEQMYGCVNCRNSDPRYCAESGHSDCDAGRVPDVEPAP